MTDIIETPAALEIRDRLRPGMRVVFALLALFPLLAPYDLVLRPKWESYFNLPFAFVLVICAGALAVSGFLAFAAVAGLNTEMKFDSASRTFTHSSNAPVVPMRKVRYPFAEIDRIEIQTHDWSDGPPTFSLRVVMKDGRAFSTGSSWDRAQIEEARRRAGKVLQREFPEREPG